MRVAGSNFKLNAAPFVEGRMRMARKNVPNLTVVASGPRMPAPKQP